ncbi:basic proline-rich protein-like [Haemorhous mexicanus]|uniref:basic proline-rich protein-like n=1 Tax=Haemorhous mexicanus TaxID=30427 RepID=UPI0028BD8A84|nr:basic proline-rich protein-like [Haemorhous mexicanus]
MAAPRAPQTGTPCCLGSHHWSRAQPVACSPGQTPPSRAETPSRHRGASTKGPCRRVSMCLSGAGLANRGGIERGGPARAGELRHSTERGHGSASRPAGIPEPGPRRAPGIPSVHGAPPRLQPALSTATGNPQNAGARSRGPPGRDTGTAQHPRAGTRGPPSTPGQGHGHCPPAPGTPLGTPAPPPRPSCRGTAWSERGPEVPRASGTSARGTAPRSPPLPPGQAARGARCPRPVRTPAGRPGPARAPRPCPRSPRRRLPRAQPPPPPPPTAPGGPARRRRAWQRPDRPVWRKNYNSQESPRATAPRRPTRCAAGPAGSCGPR